MKMVDIIIPRGGENTIAIDLLIRKIKTQLEERGKIFKKYHFLI